MASKQLSFPQFKLSHQQGENELVDVILKRWAHSLSGQPTTEVLPPGIDINTWKVIFSKFLEVLGEEGVIVGDEHKLNYLDIFSLRDNEQDVRGSPCAVCPTTVEHIQAILKIANEYKIPVWTVARGKNLGYGTNAGRIRGSVIIDLQNMDKVIEINDHFSYYTVEPGVSFFKLYEEIQKQKKNVWMSVPALGWGSVVGNTLDRGWGYTPHGDHNNQICGLEAVLADGTLVRTGMGALSEKMWPLFRGGYGPTYESLFSQSNFGIITKLTLWSSPAPLGFMSCHIRVQKETDLVQMVDIFQDLLKHDVIQNHPVIGNILRELGKRGTRKKWYDGKGAIPDWRLEELAKEMDLSWWDANFGLYGPNEIIEVNFKRCQEAFNAIPGARLRGNAYYPDPSKGQKYLPASAVPYQDAWLQTGEPSMGPIVSIQYRGLDGGHISFSPVLPAEGQAALDWYYEAKKICAKYGFDFMAGLHLYQRHLAHLIMIYFDRTDQDDKTAANELFVKLVLRAKDFGYGEYRAHIDHMDLVADQYNFGAADEGANGVPALMRMNNRIKDALDPNGVLSPGKQGIWPKQYRGNKAKGSDRGQEIRELKNGDGVDDITNVVKNGL
ncbi:FAD binding domain-containing protein [Phialemonium atrogriseum]|uniref:FAD binding domain-containing protein n=1 Tax=Phialemonium atrogriseum TaxID=1093897 RepID=A0AAJ0BUS8_9PEZI|nr:FAD binding domain-containing protein [Phialemonium atrogriseum]KAK1763773.1 FAD binding domain-containing protein [Phialemonium atrogriseum]